MKSRKNSLRNSKPKQKHRSRHLNKNKNKNKKFKHRVSLRGGGLTDTEKLALLAMTRAGTGLAGLAATAAAAAEAQATAAQGGPVEREVIDGARVLLGEVARVTRVRSAVPDATAVEATANTIYTFEHAISDFQQNALNAGENIIYQNYLDPNTQEGRNERERARIEVEPILNRVGVSIEARKLLAFQKLRRLADDYYNDHRPIDYLPVIDWD